MREYTSSSASLFFFVLCPLRFTRLISYFFNHFTYNMTERNKSTIGHEFTPPRTPLASAQPIEAPPSYTPRAITPLHPPPRSSSPPPPLPQQPRPNDGPPTPILLPVDRIHIATSIFSQDLTQIKDTSANVVCPRCHYGVQTKTNHRAGTHAGYPSNSPRLMYVVCGLPLRV